jgi:small GTP-binding protein
MKNFQREKAAKILVAGHFGAGKTTFVKTISENKTVETERETTLDEEKSKKRTTTVAMDYGEYTKNGKKYHIFGIPGQERFEFMWPILAKNTKGFIVLLDSTDTSRWYEVFKQLNVLRKISKEAAIIFVANKRDLPDALPLEEIREKLKLPKNIKLVECVATDRKKVEKVLETLIEEMENKSVV